MGRLLSLKLKLFSATSATSATSCTMLAIKPAKHPCPFLQVRFLQVGHPGKNRIVIVSYPASAAVAGAETVTVQELMLDYASTVQK
jgi:hypothetical protein